LSLDLANEVQIKYDENEFLKLPRSMTPMDHNTKRKLLFGFNI